MHMAFGILMVMVQTYIHLRFKFKNINDLRFSEAQDVQELRHEIAVWQRAGTILVTDFFEELFHKMFQNFVQLLLCRHILRMRIL